MVSFGKAIYLERSYDELRNRVATLERQLQQAGLRVSQSSRLVSYRTVLERTASTPRQQSRYVDYRLLHQAILECSQLSLIVSELSRPPSVANWPAKVQTILSGNRLPEKNRSSLGRNTQAELFFASLARSVGYTVTLEEPDVRLKEGRDHFGLAVKRPRSHANLMKIVGRANRQIVTSGLHGVITLDLSNLLPSAEPTAAIEYRAAQASYSAAITEFMTRNALRIRNRVDFSRSFGLIVLISGLAVLTDMQQLAAVISCRAVNLCSEHDQRCHMIERLAQKLGEVRF